MEYSPSSTIETTDEDKDVYLYELNNLHNFNPLPPPPILDPYHPQPMHHHQPSSQSSNGHQYHHQLHASHSLPHIQQHQMMHNQQPGSLGSVSNGSPISNRQNSIQSVNSYHIDNDSQNNPLIFSNANNSYTSIQDFDSSSLLYNLDYELGSFESIDSLNTPTPNQSFNTSFNNSVTTSSSTFHQLQSQTNYFDYHNSNHFDYAFDKDKFISKNLSQTFSDVSPLNKHQEFISLNNNNGNGNANGNMATMESTPTHSNISTVNTTESSTPTLPQLTTFHHHPSLPNLQLVNGEYDKFSNSPTPDSPIKTPVDYQKYKRKKKPFNHAYSVPHSISTSNLSASINNSPQIGLRGLGGLGGLGVSVEDDSPISSTNTPVKKYTRRRLLPRSKNGCWICRIKHLKCDESKPQCSSCVKYGISCDYSSEKPSYVTDKNLRNKKLIEITQIRKNNHKLKPKKSKKRLDD